MTAYDTYRLDLTRRHFLKRSSRGIGSLGLAALLNENLFAAEKPSPIGLDHWAGVATPVHVPAKCKRVIWLYMAGGPSHLESFDYKPTLEKFHNQPMPKSLTEGEQIAQLQGKALNVFGPQHGFKRHGKSGQMINDVFPKIGTIADDICIIKSLKTEQINHDPAHTFMNTGSIIPGRPSMGSWLTYGLGSECDNLPGFVVLTSAGGGQGQPIATRQWHNGFLPGRFQGVEFQSSGDPVNYIGRPKGLSLSHQEDVVRASQQMNALGNEALDDPEIATKISQYEMAFRMHTSVPELVDFSDEPKHIMEMYGTKGADGSFAANCLLARRMAERGVRFIQCYHRGWDHHGGIKKGMKNAAEHVDQASAALVKDLKQRGMLDETMVIWAGEFGRTPMAQGSGRDHHIKGFSGWLTGGGIKPGISYGETDDFGYNAVKDVVHVHDLHATILHQMGINHKKLIYRFQGRDFRLTDVHGHLVKDILS